MVNCIDNDGQNKGFDLPLLSAMRAAVSIPVIASSGAGCEQHFSAVFREVGMALSTVFTKRKGKSQ